ncbi:unnamed protein product [Meganyctiphanes norvegica]|uniref:Uncharacterized protein n=1 Tax=Meganyctiphanes norvegica TaxID=48144 RepID=A0AAV2S846_MEGNR
MVLNESSQSLYRDPYDSTLTPHNTQSSIRSTQSSNSQEQSAIVNTQVCEVPNSQNAENNAIPEWPRYEMEEDNTEYCGALACLKPQGNTLRWILCEACSIWHHKCIGLNENKNYNDIFLSVKLAGNHKHPLFGMIRRKMMRNLI